MADQHNFLGALPGDRCADDLECAVVKAGVHVGSHAHWPLAIFLPLLNKSAQPLSLARAQRKAKAFALSVAPPKGGVLDDVRQSPRRAHRFYLCHPVEEDPYRAASQHGQVVNSPHVAPG